MRDQRPARDELISVTALLALAWLVGQLTGLGHALLWLGLLSYISWHLIQLSSLLLWLRSPEQPTPRAAGIWNEVYYRLALQHREHDEELDGLHAQIQDYSETAQALPFATVTLDHEFQILNANAKAARLLGIHPSDRGQDIDSLIRDPSFHGFLRTRKFDVPIELPATLNRDQTLSFQVVSINRLQYLMIVRDITERRKLEAAQRDFVANVSHELRTPLTVLQGTLEQLEDQAQSDPAWRRPLGWMDRQTQRMIGIVEDLLTLAQMERQTAGEGQQTRYVDFSALATSAIQDAQQLSDQHGGHQIDSQIAPGIEIFGAKQGLRAAAANLINNAVRYTPAGGSITIALRRENNGIVFSVSDTGPGIAPRHLARLTERFYRADDGRSRDQGGTGLGLAIVKHVLESFGSRLEIDSTLGVGSTFRFHIGKDWLKDEDALAAVSH